jgi:transcriptional regulator with XRE-family HTH domain
MSEATRKISDLPALLRDARFLRGLDLRTAAEQIGVASSTLMRWEKGTSSPNFDQLDRAAAWLGLEITLTRKPA